MRHVLSVSALRCRMWGGHERLEDQISVDTCRDEIASVQRNGQLIPVLARPLTQDPLHDFELIYGARRLFIARHLNVPLLIELREIADRDAIIALDIENRQRKDFSPYERGRSFTAWLRAGHFSSQDELAKALSISPSQVSRLLALSQLPTVLVAAFASPLEICETWGRDLMELWNDPEGRKVVTAGARAIGKLFPRPSGATVHQLLIATPATGGQVKRRPGSEGQDEVVKDKRGRPLFRVSVRQKDVAILLPSNRISPAALIEIKDQLVDILQRASPQVVDITVNRPFKLRSGSESSSHLSRIDTAGYFL